jgi:hypothetical protein
MGLSRGILPSLVGCDAHKIKWDQGFKVEVLPCLDLLHTVVTAPTYNRELPFQLYLICNLTR